MVKIPKEMLESEDVEAIKRIARVKIKGDDLLIHNKDVDLVFNLIEENGNKSGGDNQLKTLSLRALTALLRLSRQVETPDGRAAVLAGALQLAQIEPSLAGRANAIIASLR